MPDILSIGKSVLLHSTLMLDMNSLCEHIIRNKHLYYSPAPYPLMLNIVYKTVKPTIYAIRRCASCKIYEVMNSDFSYNAFYYRSYCGIITANEPFAVSKKQPRLLFIPEAFVL